MIPIANLARQHARIRPELDSAIAAVLTSGEFVLGHHVADFEEAFANYCGSRWGVGVNSGTSALHLALLAAGIGAGHEVITTAFNLVPQLLIGTSRIATLHLRLAKFYQRYLPLKLIAPPVEIPPLEELMQWHKSRDRDPGTAWLRSLLKDAIGFWDAQKSIKPAVRRAARA